MKSFLFAALAASAILGLNAPSHAQNAINEMSKDVRVKIKKLGFQFQKTPDFSVNNVTQKRWKPKEWLEIEAEFEAAKSPEKMKEDKSRFIDALEFRYYVAFQAKDATTGKTKFATGTVTHVNIPMKQESASVMYISPASLIQILDKDAPAGNDVVAIAVEVYYGGELCGFESKGAGNAGWWKNAESLTDVGSVMLDKTKTPFAILWGDYHADVQQR